MKRSPTLSATCSALAVIAVALVGIEAVVRFSSRQIARGADDLTTLPAYVTKLAAFERTVGPRIAVLGDSVALGDTLAKHGVSDWKRRNLDAALVARVQTFEAAPLIANFAANGLRPSDVERAAADLIDSGARKLVIVVGLRALSEDFEPENARFEQPWRRKYSSAAPNAAGQLAGFWQTRGAVDLTVSGLIGGPFSAVLTRWRVAARSARDDDELTVALQAAQRFRSAAVSPERVQSQALRHTLQKAQAGGAQIVLVYATENPDYVEQLAPPSQMAKARAGLESLAADFPQTVQYIGPDDGAAPEDFVDFIHPSARGYARMAERIAPLLVR